jgi:putative ABC transport system permease protein
MNIALLRGRVFNDADAANSPPVMVVSNAFAKQYFPSEDAIGKRIILDGDNKTPQEIIGVVGDVRRNGLDVAVQPEMYFSYLQKPERRMNLVLRTGAADASQLTQAARAEVKAFNPAQIVWRVQTLEQLL